MGIDSTVPVRAGGNVQIVCKPHVSFKPLQLMIPEGTRDIFMINQLLISRTSQFVSKEGIIGLMFSEYSNWQQPEYNIIQSFQEIVFTVTNLSACSARFYAVFRGETVEESLDA